MRHKEMLVLIILVFLFPQIVIAEPTPDSEFENIEPVQSNLQGEYMIENVEIKTNPTNSTINWTTTVGTKSYIEYYPEENFTLWGKMGIPIIPEPYFVVDPKNEPSPTDYPYIMNHSMTLAGLKPNTTYVFRIKAKDIYDTPEIYESNFTTIVIPAWEQATSTEQVTFNNTPDYGQIEDDEPSNLLRNGLLLGVAGIVILALYNKMK